MAKKQTTSTGAWDIQKIQKSDKDHQKKVDAAVKDGWAIYDDVGPHGETRLRREAKVDAQ